MGVVTIFISGRPDDVEASAQYLVSPGTRTPRKVVYTIEVPCPFNSEWLRRQMEIEIKEKETINEGNVQ